jgi:predicted nucleic acid-binding Zn ribbon protein
MPEVNPAPKENAPVKHCFCWPDTRAFLIGGLFFLTVMVLLMVRENPKLTENPGFMVLAQSIIIAGLITAGCGFYFTASKSSEDKNTILATQARALEAGNNTQVSPTDTLDVNANTVNVKATDQ